MYVNNVLSAIAVLDINTCFIYNKIITMADYPVVYVLQAHIWPFLMPCLSSFALLTDTKSK
jgi:hypothetical protein